MTKTKIGHAANKRFCNMVAGRWNCICVLLLAVVPADEYLWAFICYLQLQFFKSAAVVGW